MTTLGQVFDIGDPEPEDLVTGVESLGTPHSSSRFARLCGAIREWDCGQDDGRYPVWVGTLASFLIGKGYASDVDN